MKPDFALDPRLAQDSHFILDGPLSQLRLMDDARFDWLVLVPRRAGAVEWLDLDPGDQDLLWQEATRAASVLRALGACDKLNLGALGNIVRQLHVHVIARREGDAAWPGPVWGSGPAARRDASSRDALLARCRQLWAG